MFFMLYLFYICFLYFFFFFFFFFFCLMIRRPPRSTLFPTRRSSDLRGRRRVIVGDAPDRHRAGLAVPDRVAGARSEEHTSELQSRLHLVCRLLLEKKKKKHDFVAEGTTKNITRDVR